jgi:hypothetical protein
MFLRRVGIASMKSSEWKDAMVDLLDGVERELGPSIPIAAQAG